MTTQEALHRIVVHLLGQGWLIADVVGGERANEIIVEEIMKKYEPADEDPVDKYRRTDKKCVWCDHYNDTYIGGECKAKGTMMSGRISRKPHRFCKLFKPNYITLNVSKGKEK